MPQTRVVFYAEGNVAPFLRWLDALGEGVQNKVIARIELLAARGHELRRPHADTLRDGVHELRIVSQHVNYRVLYFFHGRTAIVSHGIAKEGAVPSREIDRAIHHREQFAADPAKHTFTEE